MALPTAPSPKKTNYSLLGKLKIFFTIFRLDLQAQWGSEHPFFSRTILGYHFFPLCPTAHFYFFLLPPATNGKLSKAVFNPLPKASYIIIIVSHDFNYFSYADGSDLCLHSAFLGNSSLDLQLPKDIPTHTIPKST